MSEPKRFEVYLPLDEVIERMVIDAQDAFDVVVAVSPFIASRYAELADKSFIYEGKLFTLVGSWQEASGFPVMLMFKTGPA